MASIHSVLLSVYLVGATVPLFNGSGEPLQCTIGWIQFVGMITIAN